MKKFVIAIIALLLVGAVAAWYFLRPKDKAREVVPADATSVVVLEPQKMIEELGLEAEDVQKLGSNFEGVLKAVDLAEPVYAFQTEDGQSGLSLNLKDAEKLVKAISALGFANEEQQGLKWITDGNSVGCLDKDKLLLFLSVAATQQDALKPLMKKLMQQGKQDVKVLDELGEQDGFLKVNTALNNLPDKYVSGLSKGIKLSDSRVNAGLGIGKKDITLSASLADSPLAHVEGWGQPIEGNLFNLQPADPVFWLCFNIKGETLLNFLRQQPQLRTALLGLNMMADVDMMLKAIDGDVLITMPKLDIKNPELLLTATLANADFLKNAGDWDGITKRGAQDFMASLEGIPTYFGVRNGVLYLTNSQKLADSACETTGVRSVPAMANGKCLSAALNADQIIKSYPGLSLMLSAIPGVRSAVNGIEGLTLSVSPQQDVELSLKTNEPVKDIVKDLKKLLNAL